MEYDVSFQTISWFNERKGDETLEISPKFQRRAVWLEKERALLLETILSSLPFPEIYVHVETNPDDGKQIYAVVDGQQRITSILKFIANEFSLPVNDVWNGEYFRDLPSELKTRFWDYKIVVRSLRQTNDEEIRSLFVKLNTNNIVLNDQELRNARYVGRFKELAERLADNPFFQSVGLFTPRDVRRMLDIEYVSELLVRQIAGVSNKKDLLDGFYTQYDDDFPLESKYEDEFNICINLARSIITTENQIIFKTKGNFYSLFGVCLDYYRRTSRTQFISNDAIAIAVSDFVSRVKSTDSVNQDKEVQEYQAASSRATSDKLHRAARERILSALVRGVEPN